jgi:tRNA dimethylallyltransferase
MELDEAIERIKINTRRLAKGQRTWFKTFRQVHWIDIEPEEADKNVLEWARRYVDGNSDEAERRGG